MRIEVAVVYLDDEGRPLWSYSHGEGVPGTGDPEQNALAAAGMLTAHLDGAKAAITAQSNADLKRMKDGPGS